MPEGIIEGKYVIRACAFDRYMCLLELVGFYLLDWLAKTDWELKLVWREDRVVASCEVNWVDPQESCGVFTWCAIVARLYLLSRCIAMVCICIVCRGRWWCRFIWFICVRLFWLGED